MCELSFVIQKLHQQNLSKFMNQFQQDIKRFKTIIIGKQAVGKSTVLLRYVEGQFDPQKATVGIDYKYKIVTHEGQTFNLELWDTAGQQRYRTIVFNFFKLSKAACIVFDITSQESLNDAKMWMQQLVLHCGNDIPKLLLGNKCDLLDPTKLEQQIEKFKPKIDQLIAEYQCKFFPVSAYDGTNIQEAFQYLIKELFERSKFDKKPISKPKTVENIKITNKDTNEGKKTESGKKWSC